MKAVTMLQCCDGGWRMISILLMCGDISLLAAWLPGASHKISLFLCSLSELWEGEGARDVTPAPAMMERKYVRVHTVATGDTKISQTRIPEPRLRAWQQRPTHKRRGGRSIWHDTKCQLDYFLSCAGGFLYQFPNININISCSQFPYLLSGQVNSSHTGWCRVLSRWERSMIVLCILNPDLNHRWVKLAQPDLTQLPSVRGDQWPVCTHHRVMSSVSIQTQGWGGYRVSKNWCSEYTIRE